MRFDYFGLITYLSNHNCNNNTMAAFIIFHYDLLLPFLLYKYAFFYSKQNLAQGLAPIVHYL